MNFLAVLLDEFNDDQRKNFYCNGINQLSIEDIREIREYISSETRMKNLEQKEKIKTILLLFKEKAMRSNIDLVLRK